MATVKQPVYGLMAEFETPEQILQAALRTHAAGYKKIDAYTPIPVEGLAEAIGFEWTSLPMVVFTGGFLGGSTGFFMCWYANVISFPLNIGGKPLQQLAGLDSDHLRIDDSGRGAGGGVRHDHHEWLAAAVPPGIQRFAVCAGVHRPLLSVH